ncbi:hypothetical protein FBZ90_11424 [Nitrospirillum pindoramense]|uniref:Uncharacterized protein n=1 Tax=Nitrospirillum amazonense TaxID=28077 RepID=A0A560GVB6_9PROT|nr:hypothetical protein FBZ90_11424 [Nitrospirillum amazonense]
MRMTATAIARPRTEAWAEAYLPLVALLYLMLLGTIFAV